MSAFRLQALETRAVEEPHFSPPKKRKFFMTISIATSELGYLLK
jgi:hypothetical protein